MTNEVRLQPVEVPVASAAGASLSGTESQIEWAVRIRRSVEREFDRVAKAFLAVAAQQTSAERGDIDSLISILEDKRAEVMAHGDAGYFIREWQELRDQVRQMIAADPRYPAIRSRRLTRPVTGD
ncbi:MAG TPA: hypothetical protein VES20_09730 [Bryobacteraceae bacterium]|nr:hypothetical protein [Bryobacteraceae bacterium]